MNCLSCSSPLLPGSRRRYCSDACRVSAYRLRKLRHRKVSLAALTASLSAVQPADLRLDIFQRVQRLVGCL